MKLSLALGKDLKVHVLPPWSLTLRIIYFHASSIVLREEQGPLLLPMVKRSPSS